MNHEIRIKRAYEPPDEADGRRFLVDRIWPRGVKKEDLRLEGWLKEVAPSNELRRWFGHREDRWPEFERRYRVELRGKNEVLQPILEQVHEGVVTLVYGARDEQHNNAVVLKKVLEDLLVE